MVNYSVFIPLVVVIFLVPLLTAPFVRYKISSVSPEASGNVKATELAGMAEQSSEGASAAARAIDTRSPGSEDRLEAAILALVKSNQELLRALESHRSSV